MIRPNDLHLYDTLTHMSRPFVPLNPPHVGLYVCGPTMYGDAHLGHARPAITFDVLTRYLRHLGYHVRYVRNITDVGHLEHDADDGDDKIQKRARLEGLEPMEVVDYYLNRYHHDIEALGCLPPSIEPHASGHIIEQIQYVKAILDAGYAYVTADGSVYFDLQKYTQDHPYGHLSGRRIEELLATTRELDGQSQKHHPADFALWKAASPTHIMHWPSPWGEGYPGWHLECSTMSEKYLGTTFDIHGGGLDLMFPHHECEIAQSTAHNGAPAPQLWMHNNLITVDHRKMGKSLGNFITLEQLFTGNHPLLSAPVSPMAVRLFILMAHYRGTLDFSDSSLQAAGTTLSRIQATMQTAQKLTATAEEDDSTLTGELDTLERECYAALDDDLNTPVLLATLQGALRIVNNIDAGRQKASASQITRLRDMLKTFLGDILGISYGNAGVSDSNGANAELLDAAMTLLLDMRRDAKAHKDYATADRIRDALTPHGVKIKDNPDGTTSYTLS